MSTYKHFISAANGNFASQLSGGMAILRWNHESMWKIMIICLVSEIIEIQSAQFMNGGPLFFPLPSFFLSIHILKGTYFKAKWTQFIDWACCRRSFPFEFTGPVWRNVKFFQPFKNTGGCWQSLNNVLLFSGRGLVMPLTYCSENKGEYAWDIELSFSRCFCSVSGVKEKKSPAL